MGGGRVVEKLKRCVRTVFFMVAMLASLLTTSLPLLVALADVLAQCLLVTSFACVSCYGVKEHFRKYAFKSSLVDIPLVSVVRSFIVVCVYSFCDGPTLSHGPYVGIVSFCSLISILFLSVKACVFSVHSQVESESSLSLTKRRLHLKKSWGMPVLFLSSVVFALGHMVVAYRTSCRARRKLLFHRVDPEAVLSCKTVFSSFQKVPRSPTPSGGKTPKSDSEMRRKPFGAARNEGEFPVRLVADVDSLFINCQGLAVHYKLSLPGSPHHSLSSSSFLDSTPSCSSPKTAGRLKHDRRPSNGVLKAPLYLHRSYSNQFSSSSLYDPLLEGYATSILAEDIPLSLDNIHGGNEMIKLNPGTAQHPVEGSGQFGIVLVHGFGGGVFSWRHVMGVLAQQVGCMVAAFDRPGWGLTSRPLRKDWEEKELPNPYKLDTQVDLLFSFCSGMGFSSVVLVGHDDGGLLALKAIERHRASPNSFNVAIKGVILLNVSFSRELVPAFARILLRTSLGKKHLVRPLLRTEITQVVNRRAWYNAAKMTPEVLSLYKAPLFVEGWDEALHEIGKLSCETVLSTQNVTSLLQSVEEMPVLVIACDKDVLVPLKYSQTMASKIVNSRLVAISECGHLPHEECPKILLGAMLPFINRLLSDLDIENQ